MLLEHFCFNRLQYSHREPAIPLQGLPVRTQRSHGTGAFGMVDYIHTLANTLDPSALLAAHHAGSYRLLRRAVVVDLIRLGIDVSGLLATVHGWLVVFLGRCVRRFPRGPSARIRRRDDFEARAS